jgi:hypothetical protein
MGDIAHRHDIELATDDNTYLCVEGLLTVCHILHL